jgi:hypothetical protein
MRGFLCATPGKADHVGRMNPSPGLSPEYRGEEMIQRNLARSSSVGTRHVSLFPNNRYRYLANTS